MDRLGTFHQESHPEAAELDFYCLFQVDNRAELMADLPCLLKSLPHTQIFCFTSSDTFESRVSTESSASPVSCGDCREVLALDVTPGESAVSLNRAVG